MKVFKLIKSILLTLAIVFVASLMWAIPAKADMVPENANTNAFYNGIGRPDGTYREGDTIRYNVTVWVPVAEPETNSYPAQQTDIVTTFTSPNGMTVTLPGVAVLNPGESRTFTGADNSALDYVIRSQDYVAFTFEGKTKYKVTGSAHAEAVSHTSRNNDTARGTMDITTVIASVDAAPTLTPNPTATTIASAPGIGGGSDGRSDGLGCGSHDCSTRTPMTAVLAAISMPNTGFGPRNSNLWKLFLLNVTLITLTAYFLTKTRSSKQNTRG